jgi:hypothetical protein
MSGLVNWVKGLVGGDGEEGNTSQTGGGKKKHLPRIRNRLHIGNKGGVFEIKHHKKVYECKPKSKKSKKSKK